MGRILKYVKKEQREREKYIEGFERRDMQTRRGLESADQSVLLHRSTTELCLLFAISLIFFFFFLFFLFLVFFCLSNLTRINCGIALNYLLANGGRPCLVVSLLCKWYETRRKFRNSSVVIQNFALPEIYFRVDFLDVKHLFTSVNLRFTVNQIIINELKINY